jgi:hypothetical protein
MIEHDFGLREWMTARCADVDAALEAPRLERRLGFSRAVGAVGEHVSRCRFIIFLICGML